ncbi:MAG: hypothetical protein MUE50_01645, partial [Pirellulaceae bacterium]|nr:hypothetical protein [Pirellulaceae bacterium]
MRWKSCGKKKWVFVFLGLCFCVSGGGVPAASAADPAESYLGPCALVASPDAKTLYVACADAKQVAWV